MPRAILVVAISCLIVSHSASALRAQQPEFPQPGKEHELLQKFVGKWESDAEATMAPGQPAIKCKGTMSAKMLGGFWVVNEMQTSMSGFSMTGIQTVGYDSDRKKYVGTWVDSMMNYMWKYEGSLNKAGNKLTLEAEGPNHMAAGKMTKFRDAYEFKSATHIVATSSMLSESGEWITFMTGNMRKKD